jgi:hypothetical protein
MIRTSEMTVTFRHPFVMPSLSERQPAGTYRFVVDELDICHEDVVNNEVAGLAFLARKQLVTKIYVPALSIDRRPGKVIDIDASELAEALETDCILAGGPAKDESVVSQ